MKKSVCILLAGVMITSMLAGCGGAAKNVQPGGNSGTQANVNTGAQTDAKPKEVNFWWLFKGNESKVMESVAEKYNASQKKYVVKGLSVPDKQKIITAVSSGEGPDIISGNTFDIAPNAFQSIIDAMDNYIKQDNFDLEKFNKIAIEANKYGGKLYGMPISTTICTLFYNKDMLKSAGYSEPPKTMEELYEMAVKMTKTDADGEITYMGFPIFPVAGYPLEGTYAFGGRYISDDGKTLTPDNPGTIKALEMNLKFRKQFGLEKVNKYVASANTNRYTPQDDFFQGKQGFRIDGFWVCTMIEQNNPSLNYGIAPIPGSKDKPDAYGSSRLETGSLMIPATAKEKDGAWDVIKYYTTGEGIKTLDMGIGSVPAYIDLFEDPDMQAKKGFKEFINQLEMNKAVPFPSFPDELKYQSMINEHCDYVYNGRMSPEQAMQELKKAVASLNVQ